MKTALTDSEWTAERTRLQVEFLNQQLKKQDDEEFVKRLEIDPKGQSFRFRCSCGVIHPLSYNETPEGRGLLSVK